MAAASRYRIDAPTVNPAALRQQTPLDAPSALGLVLPQSPLAVRRAVQSLAAYARRELDYDAVGYHADAPNPRAEAWLWITEDWDDKARAIGFCVMLGDDPGTWMMTWVWFHPFERRRRHLSGAWPFLRERYGDFAVDRPSEAMQTFLASL